MMSLAAKIIHILKAHDIAWPVELEHTVICRTRAGRHQRSAGAWSWFLAASEGHHASPVGQVGSQWSATEIAMLGPEGVSIYAADYGDVSLFPKKARSTPRS